MLYEVELRRHRETHQLFSATMQQPVGPMEGGEEKIIIFRKMFIPKQLV